MGEWGDESVKSHFSAKEKGKQLLLAFTKAAK
jgi:hypothetical protein